MEEQRISESHLLVILPDRLIPQIVGKTTDLGHWYLKNKIHKKLVSNLEECFEDVRLLYNFKYLVQGGTLIINLNYTNNQYLFEIINLGDTWSDEESYVVNCLNSTVGLEY